MNRMIRMGFITVLMPRWLSIPGSRFTNQNHPLEKRTQAPIRRGHTLMGHIRGDRLSWTMSTLLAARDDT